MSKMWKCFRFSALSTIFVLVHYKWTCSGFPASCNNNAITSNHDDETVTAASPGGEIRRIETMLTDCMLALPTRSPFEAEDSSRISELIYSSMTTKGRVYHNVEHIFSVTKHLTDPIQILAALFHDLIYLSLDKSLSDAQAEPLEGVLVPDQQVPKLEAQFTDPVVNTIVKLFGFTPGAEIPKTGGNEFMSAVLSVRTLSQWLDSQHLIQIATIIESTIPFRPDVEGKTAQDYLYDRLALACPDQSEEWWETTIHKASAMTNCDLASFDTKDRDYFLDTTWMLIPEARPSILSANCSMSEYLEEFHALERRTQFLFQRLPYIFKSFRHVPSEAEMEQKRRQTYENLVVQSGYSKVRLLQIMILVEFAQIMEKDPETLPMRDFLQIGIPHVSEREQKTKTDSSLTGTQREIRDWLVSGRRTAFSWDPAASSLGAYLFDELGMTGINNAVDVGKSQKPGSHQLLKYLPENVVCAVAPQLDSFFEGSAECSLHITERLGIHCSLPEQSCLHKEDS